MSSKKTEQATSSLDWKEENYRDTYERALFGLEQRRRRDPTFNIEELKSLLEDLYSADGSDWGGRGTLQDNIMQATLAAHEAFLANWESEKNNV